MKVRKKKEKGLLPFIIASAVIHGVALFFVAYKFPTLSHEDDYDEFKNATFVDVSELGEILAKEEKKEDVKRLAEKDRSTQEEKSPKEKGVFIPPSPKAMAKDEPQIPLPESSPIPRQEEKIPENKAIEGGDVPAKISEEPPKALTEPKKEEPPKKIENLFPTDERIAKLQKERLNEPQIKEGDVLSLDTKAVPSYLYSYFTKIKRKIELIWDYPESARVKGVQGRVLVRFTIGKDGKLKEVKVMSSSGHKILDDEATNAITLAAPFGNFPKDLALDNLIIEGSFEYRISNFYTIVR